MGKIIEIILNYYLKGIDLIPIPWYDVIKIREQEEGRGGKKNGLVQCG